MISDEEIDEFMAQVTEAVKGAREEAKKLDHCKSRRIEVLIPDVDCENCGELDGGELANVRLESADGSGIELEFDEYDELIDFLGCAIRDCIDLRDTKGMN